MAKTNKAYMKQTQLVSVILALIPITSLILGFIYRFQKGHILMAVLNWVIFPVFYIADLISVVLNNDLKYLT